MKILKESITLFLAPDRVRKSDFGQTLQVTATFDRGIVSLLQAHHNGELVCTASNPKAILINALYRTALFIMKGRGTADPWGFLVAFEPDAILDSMLWRKLVEAEAMQITVVELQTIQNIWLEKLFRKLNVQDQDLESFIKSTLKPNSPPKKQIRPWAEERRAKIAREERRIAAELLASSQDEDVASDDTTLVLNTTTSKASSPAIQENVEESDVNMAELGDYETELGQLSDEFNDVSTSAHSDETNSRPPTTEPISRLFFDTHESADTSMPDLGREAYLQISIRGGGTRPNKKSGNNDDATALYFEHPDLDGNKIAVEVGGLVAVLRTAEQLKDGMRDDVDVFHGPFRILEIIPRKTARWFEGQGDDWKKRKGTVGEVLDTLIVVDFPHKKGYWYSCQSKKQVALRKLLPVMPFRNDLGVNDLLKAANLDVEHNPKFRTHPHNPVQGSDKFKATNGKLGIIQIDDNSFVAVERDLRATEDKDDDDDVWEVDRVRGKRILILDQGDELLKKRGYKENRKDSWTKHLREDGHDDDLEDKVLIVQHRILWKGWGEMDSTWEIEKHIPSKYHREYNTRQDPFRDGRKISFRHSTTSTSAGVRGVLIPNIVEEQDEPEG